MSEEAWRPVVGYEGLYEVSDRGRVRSLTRTVPCNGGYRTTRGRILRASVCDGYQTLSLVQGDGTRCSTKRVHSLVAAAFLGPRPVGHEVAHGDGDALNNCLTNLRYATRAENEADKVKHGTVLKGQQLPLSRLNPEDVLAIRARAELGESQRSIARAFNVSQRTVGNVIHQRHWTWVRDGEAVAS